MKELLKFYNLTMLLAGVVACVGGVVGNERMLSAALAMITAAGTSYQATYAPKGSNIPTPLPPPPL
jgi:hypothetical protein